MIRVLAFGTFDGLHEGHRSFLRQARNLGEYLIVAVATDEIVLELKGKLPKRNIEERLSALMAESLADIVVAGDEELGSYHVVRRHRPDLIALGYDQTALRHDLEEQHQGIQVAVLAPYKPEEYHSRLLARGR